MQIQAVLPKVTRLEGLEAETQGSPFIQLCSSYSTSEEACNYVVSRDTRIADRDELVQICQSLKIIHLNFNSLT
jgi:hypothetical protein